MRRIFVGIMLAALLISMLMLPFGIRSVRSEPKTWIVDDDEPADFHTIQEAINAASDGDTIYVQNGTYYENIIVNRTVSIIGEDKGSVIIDANSRGTVIGIYADGVILRSLTIRNSGTDLGDCGVVLSKVKNVVVEESIVNNTGAGIYVILSQNNTFSKNTVSQGWYGLRFHWSSGNNLTSNIIENNHWGILFVDANSNILRKNVLNKNAYSFGIFGETLSHFIYDVDTTNTLDGKIILYLINKKDMVLNSVTFPNVGYLAIVNSTRIKVEDMNLTKNVQGVLFAFVNDSVIENVYLTENWMGIQMVSSYGNIVEKNQIHNNTYGINMDGSSNNVLIENSITDNSDGIFSTSSDNILIRNLISNGYRGIYLIGLRNVVVENTITNNKEGLVIDFYDNRIHHNNFIDNMKQASLNLPRAVGIWDDGYPSGGNYWSDYTGVDLQSGPYQNETGSDGIGDIPYVITENNIDRYPLMNPWAPTQPEFVATVDVNPQALNLRSKGRWITAYIELPEGYDIAYINISTIMLNYTVQAELRPTAIGDYDADGVPDLMVKFKRAEVIGLILRNYQFADRFETVTLTITGYLNDGTPFQRSTPIKIILPMSRGLYKIFPI